MLFRKIHQVKLPPPTRSHLTAIKSPNSFATQQEPPHHSNPCVNFSQKSWSLVTHNSFNNSIIKHLTCGYWKFIKRAFTLESLHTVSLKWKGIATKTKHGYLQKNLKTTKRSKVIFVVIIKERNCTTWYPDGQRPQRWETEYNIRIPQTLHTPNIVITELWGPELWALRSADQRGDKPLCEFKRRIYNIFLCT